MGRSAGLSRFVRVGRSVHRAHSFLGGLFKWGHFWVACSRPFTLLRVNGEITQLGPGRRPSGSANFQERVSGSSVVMGKIASELAESGEQI